MKRILLVTIFLLLLIPLSSNATPIKQATESISFWLNNPIDSAYGIERIPDSAHVFTYWDNGTTAAFSTRSTTYPFAIGIDTIKQYGDTNYIFTDQIQDIDGTAQHGLLSIKVVLFAGDYATATHYDVQVIEDSLNENYMSVRDSLQYLVSATGFSTHSAADVWTAGTRTLTVADWTVVGDLSALALEASLYDPATDSVVVDGTIFAGLVDIITATNFADNTLDIGKFDGATAFWNEGKTGYGLTGTQTFNNTGTWTGNITGSIGSVTADVTLDDGEFAIVADSIWQADTLNHNGVVGSYGEFLYKPASASLSDAQMGVIADSVWSIDTTDASAYGATKIGILMDAKISDAGGVASISDADMAAIADSVWDKDTSDAYALTPSMGRFVKDSTKSTGFSTHNAADIWAVGTRTLTTADWTTDADLVAIAKEATVAGLNDIAATDVWAAGTRTLTVADWFKVTDSALLANRGEIASQVSDTTWDEILTAATHNTATSAGRRLRELAGVVISANTAQGAGTGTNQIQLASGEPAVDGTYDPSLVSIVGGTGSGQSRLILEYDGATKTATVNRDWKTAPNATSEYIIYGHAGHDHVNEGLATAGTASTITLNALASSVNDAYKDQAVFIVSGVGADQIRRVTGYVGATRVATVTPDWTTTPTTQSAYLMMPEVDGHLGDIYDTLANNPIYTDYATRTGIDTLMIVGGYSANAHYLNRSAADVDTAHVMNGSDTLYHLLFWHVGGTAGDAPDSVTTR